MAKTVVGLFDSYAEAQRAVVELVDSGISREDIGITAQDYDTAGRQGSADRRDEGGISGFFSSLFGGDDSDDASYYTEAVGRGGAVVTVDAETDEVADRAAAIMDRFGADVDERGAVDRDAAYTGAGRDRAGLTADEEATIPVMEEQLQVGKREVERGAVRVRTRVVERPVEEVVRLREERVRVERRPVNRAVTEADLNAFREGTFEVRERGEEAVVSKQARVVEEVAVGKEVGERTETVRDTVRRTDVDVEEAGGRARAAGVSGESDFDADRRNR
jgi:uncharacterized protein (TIGR02271 family)